MKYLIQAINTLNSVHGLINHQKLAMGSVNAEHVPVLIASGWLTHTRARVCGAL